MDGRGLAVREPDTIASSTASGILVAAAVGEVGALCNPDVVVSSVFALFVCGKAGLVF